jgi:hypothetical protein
LYTVGDVIRWNDYPCYRDEKSEKKLRWFIYLGNRKDGTSFVIMCTTTTQCDFYKPEGQRCKHTIIKIKQGQFGFESDCILDLDLGISFDEVTTELLTKHQANITKISNIKDQDITFIRYLYNKILESKIPPYIQRDIHESFNLVGITNLKKPRLR